MRVVFLSLVLLHDFLSFSNKVNLCTVVNEFIQNDQFCLLAIVHLKIRQSL